MPNFAEIKLLIRVLMSNKKFKTAQMYIKYEVSSKYV